MVLSPWLLALGSRTADYGPWTIRLFHRKGGDCKTHTFVEDRNGKPVVRQGRKAMSLVDESSVHSQESLTPDWRLKTDRLDCLATEAS